MNSKVAAAATGYSMLKQKKLPKSDINPARKVVMLSFTTTLSIDSINRRAEQQDEPRTYDKNFYFAIYCVYVLSD